MAQKDEKTVRLAAFSDIHGNLTALEAALADLQASGGADHIWFLGDYSALGARPAAIIDRVREMIAAVADDEAKKHTIRAISGNTDRYIVTGERPRGKAVEDADALARMRMTIAVRDTSINWATDQLDFDRYRWLAKLGGETGMHVEGYGYVLAYHGTPGDDEGRLLPDTSDEETADALLDREGRLGIGGHTHIQMDRTLPIGGWRAVNIGSVGSSFDMPGKAQWGLFTFADGEVTVDLRAVPYDTEAAIADLRAAGLPTAEAIAMQIRHGRVGR